MNSPKFSIITINYNNVIGLKKTIESVIRQTYTNYEYIVIDGGSTDNSCSILESNRDRIGVIISEPDSGIYHAMNKGWKIANGEYCLFLNSGDIFADNYVLSDMQYNMDPTADIVYGCHLWGSLTGPRWNPKKDFRIRDIFTHTPISHQATFIKKSLLEKIGGFKTQYTIIADWGVLIDSMYLQAKLQKINRDVCIAELPGVSNLSDYEIKQQRFLFLRNHYFYYYIFVRFILLPIVSLKRKLTN